jgi:hypothetical protein
MFVIVVASLNFVLFVDAYLVEVVVHVFFVDISKLESTMKFSCCDVLLGLLAFLRMSMKFSY